MAEVLSKSDLEILRCLQKDATMTRQSLAEETALSATSVWRRLNDLQENGVVQSQVALVDPEKVGFPVCVFVFANLKNYEPKTREAFENYVMRTPEIMECYTVTGANDYTLLVRTRSVADFKTFLMESILGHKSVASATSQIALHQQKYTTALPI